ncbi:MAG: site-2 protease family protein [Methanophagales archaeon]|nr:site-2 protease family protein [Methanophagales archaeon]
MSFLIILLLVIWIFAVSNFEIERLTIILGFGGMDIPTWLRYLLGVIAAGFFFITLLLHELSHSFVAQRYGAHVHNITLFVLGGMAQIEDIPREPGKEANVAAAGPALSLGLGAIAYAVYYVFGPVSTIVVENVTVPVATFQNAILIVLGIIAFYNILLGFFNLIPALPMDGGRILRAGLAMRMPYIDATRLAVAIGKSFAIAIGILGIITLAVGGLWLLIIAIFIYFAGSAEEKAAVVSITLEGIKVRDIMTAVPEVIYVPPNWMIDQLIDLMFKTRHMGYPVQESQDSRVLGVITFSDVQKVRDSMQSTSTTRVAEIMNRELITISPDADSYEALKIMSMMNIGRLIVIDKDDREMQIQGIVSRTDLVRAIQFSGIYGDYGDKKKYW